VGLPLLRDFRVRAPVEYITLLVADKNVTPCSKLDKIVVVEGPGRKQMRSNWRLQFGTSIAFHGMHSAEVIE
jgi:hypothetical protein